MVFELQERVALTKEVENLLGVLDAGAVVENQLFFLLSFDDEILSRNGWA